MLIKKQEIYHIIIINVKQQHLWITPLPRSLQHYETGLPLKKIIIFLFILKKKKQEKKLTNNNLFYLYLDC